MKKIATQALLSCCLVIFFAASVSAQRKEKTLHYGIEVGGFMSTASTNPFWIRSNQFGEVPLNAQGITFRAQLKKEYDIRKDKKFSYGYGLRAVVNAGTTSQFLLSEAYGKIRYGAFELSAGRRQEIFGLTDTTLGSGAYIWSGNALPVPKLQISIPNYVPIVRSGLIAIKGNYAHGWFGTGDSLKNYYLHQKSIYVRIGKPDWRFKFHMGMNHQVQWGGQLLYKRSDAGVQITSFGSNLNSYWHVVTAAPLVADIPVQNGQASAEGSDYVGNHLGSIDLALEYENDQARLLLYRQSMFEDLGILYLNNISDGLLGLSINRKLARNGIQRIVIEYLHTSNQGGDIAYNRTKEEKLRGQDNYFNDSRYIDGWVYKGQTIGTPFIMPLQYSSNLPQNLANNPNRIINNRVNAFIVGVKSRINQIDLITRVSTSHNLGSYKSPLDINQLSLQQQIIFPLKEYKIHTTVAYDNAGVLQQNLGVSLLVKRYF